MTTSKVLARVVHDAAERVLGVLLLLLGLRAAEHGMVGEIQVAQGEVDLGLNLLPIDPLPLDPVNVKQEHIRELGDRHALGRVLETLAALAVVDAPV